MLLSVTALYAGLLALVGIAIAGFAGRARVAAGVSLGDGGKPQLLEAMRRHANFVEFVPLFLVLLAIVEINGLARTWVHALGLIVLVARIVHPFGIKMDTMNTLPRFIGTVGTFLPTVAVALIAVWQGLR
jgi:uncharacterized protein